jgi:hypothetical protein
LRLVSWFCKMRMSLGADSDRFKLGASFLGSKYLPYRQ